MTLQVTSRREAEGLVALFAETCLGAALVLCPRLLGVMSSWNALSVRQVPTVLTSR